jgi:hypothetical protein
VGGVGRFVAILQGAAKSHSSIGVALTNCDCNPAASPWID